jgi:lysine 2,3-aminomutase
MKVRPYYLFHCDPVIGAGHFRTSVWKGLEIIEGLRGHLSGLGIPTYVVDSPHGGGKIPLMPNYLVSASDDAVVLRNFEGLLVRYQAEDKPTTIKPTKTRGVSALLQGTQSAIIPKNNERLARRKQLTVVKELSNDHGCCDGDSDERPPLRSRPEKTRKNGSRRELLPLLLAAGPKEKKVRKAR